MERFVAGLAGHTPVAVGGTANSNPDAWVQTKEWSKKADGSWSDPSFDANLPAVHGPNAMELSRQVTQLGLRILIEIDRISPSFCAYTSDLETIVLNLLKHPGAEQLRPSWLCLVI